MKNKKVVFAGTLNVPYMKRERTVFTMSEPVNLVQTTRNMT